MNKCLTIIFVTIISVGMSSSYFLPQINDAVENINREIDWWADYFFNNFYHHSFGQNQLNGLTDQIGQTAASAPDLAARSHVINKRQNYTEFFATITNLMLESRESVTDDIRSKKETVFRKADDIDLYSRTLDHELRKRRGCNESQANEFYDYYSAEIQRFVIADIHEASDSYETLILERYLPLYLVRDVFQKFTNCLINGGDALKCILRAEDFYMRFTIDIMKMSLAAFETTLSNLNYRIEHQILSDIESYKYTAYRNATTYKCK